MDSNMERAVEHLQKAVALDRDSTFFLYRCVEVFSLVLLAPNPRNQLLHKQFRIEEAQQMLQEQYTYDPTNPTTLRCLFLSLLSPRPLIVFAQPSSLDFGSMSTLLPSLCFGGFL